MKPINSPQYELPVKLPANYPLTTEDDDGVAAGDDEASEAPKTKKPKSSAQGEYTRLSEEMVKFGARNAWAGVEADFQAILKLKDVTIEAPIYMLAAKAARDSGNIYDYYMRAQATRDCDPDTAANRAKTEEAIKDARDSMADVQTTYGFVSITVPDDALFTLVAKEPPFAPDQRASLTFIQGKISNEHTFIGLIPAGDYTIKAGSAESSSTPSQTFHIDPMGDSGEAKVYKTINIEASQQTEQSAAKAHKPRLVIGEFGIAGGYRTLRPTYGTAYSLGGPETLAFAGAHTDIKLGQHVLIRPGVRASYSTTILHTMDDSAPQYDLANQAVMGSARLFGLYHADSVSMGAGVSLSHGINFTEQGSFSPVIGGGEFNSSVGVGSADVALDHVSILQTPTLGAAITIEKSFGAAQPIALEVGFQNAIVGIEGTVVDHPEWISMAPFSSSLYYANLGIGF